MITRRVWTAALLAGVFVLSSCRVPTDPGAIAGTPTVNQGMPWVDMTKLPAPNPGWGDVRMGTPAPNPPIGFAHDFVGAFRTFCLPSHMAADDPIVLPNQPGASHLHTFFGNTGTNAASTAASIAGSGNSTCHGGIANRSAYWVPSIIDTATGAPVQADSILVYYKSGYSGVDPSQITVPPAGLRMIAGSAAANPSNPQVQQPGQLSPYASWTCNQKQAGRTAAIPASCGPGSTLFAEIRFPQCWDGVNLDSADHKSHMAYGTWGPKSGQNGAGCPADHPVAIPEITMFVQYTVPASGVGAWRLASDNYGGDAGGYSLHADWYNGWDPAVLSTWVNNCARSLDCQVDYLGDGRRLI